MEYGGEEECDKVSALSEEIGSFEAFSGVGGSDFGAESDVEVLEEGDGEWECPPEGDDV